MGYVEVKELVNTLHHSLAEVKDGDTLLDVEAEALDYTLADIVAEVKTGKVGEILTDLKAAPPVVTLAHTIAEMEAETIGKILSNVQAQALVDTLSAALSEVGIREKTNLTLNEVEADAVVHTLVDTLS